MTSPVQEYFDNFENLKFDPFKSKDIFLDDSNDPGKNFYDNIQAVATQYYFPSELLFLSEKLHVNSENFVLTRLFEVLRKTFKMFCLIKLGLMIETVKVRFTNCHNTQLFIRSPSHESRRGGGISMYIHNSLNFESQRDLDISTKNVESKN